MYFCLGHFLGERRKRSEQKASYHTIANTRPWILYAERHDLGKDTGQFSSKITGRKGNMSGTGWRKLRQETWYCESFYRNSSVRKEWEVSSLQPAGQLLQTPMPRCTSRGPDVSTCGLMWVSVFLNISQVVLLNQGWEPWASVEGWGAHIVGGSEGLNSFWD